VKIAKQHQEGDFYSGIIIFCTTLLKNVLKPNFQLSFRLWFS